MTGPSTFFSRRRLFQAGATGAAAAATVAAWPTAAAAAALRPGAAALAPLAPGAAPPDENGYELWLRYRPITDPRRQAEYRRAFTHVVADTDHDVVRSAQAELSRALTAMMSRPVPPAATAARGGAVVVGTWDGSEEVRRTFTRAELDSQGPEGFRLRMVGEGNHTHLVIASTGVRGVLYGAFHLLRMLQTDPPRLHRMDVADKPALPIRMINHWDNLDRTVERGYAGLSIFKWDELPAIDPRYTDYARALASVGINRTVVNNVNASPLFISSEMLPRISALAGELRKWGITFFLSANYASPILLTEGTANPITTADPLDPRVKAWWRDKVAEIYTHIPDFGGFLMKANSEGQPGPLTYGRTHADGANLLARSLKPHGGIIVWRSFVHEGFSDWAEYQHRVFAPLNGQFDENAAVQTKNGPIDFGPREPVNPLFGALPDTNQMIELQITQEYTGHNVHLNYLVDQWRWVLHTDTKAQGEGTTVRRIVDGSAYGQTNVGAAGVINFGDDHDWTGYQMGAANTHGFGRLCWNPDLSTTDIAREWTRMTFGTNPAIVEPVVDMLARSWLNHEAYTSPYGLHYLVYPNGAHYEPDPASTRNLSHYTTNQGTGYDRTVATGTGYTGQYAPPLTALYESLETCPDEVLLFMHWAPYQHRLHSGKTVIQALYDSHFDGAATVAEFRRTWEQLSGLVDPARHADILATFRENEAHARKWRDVVVSFFFGYARILDEHRQWIQVSPGASSVLLGGWPNRVPVELTNASPTPLDITAQFVAPNPDWYTAPETVTVAPTATETARLPVMPPLIADQVALDIAISPAMETLGHTGQEFVVTPAAQRCHYALDAGTGSSPLVPGYQRLAPGTRYSSATGFGWVVGTPSERDRGNFDALRRDFVGHTAAMTLRLKVPAGQQQVYALIGDGGPDSYPTFISSGGQEVARSEYLKGGFFQWVSFTLDGGAAGREVDLTFDSEPNKWWHLCALVMPNPAAPVPSVVGTGIRTASLAWTGGQPNTVSATVTNTTRSPQSVTITPQVPAGWTAAPTTVEVPPSSDMEITATVTPPPTPTLAQVPVTVTSAGTAIERTTLNVVVVPPVAATALALDAGSADTPLLDGWQALTPQSTWDPARGFGWVVGTPGFRDRARLDDLRRDLVFARDTEYVLRVQVPAGPHRLWLLTGDAYANSGETTVWEGTTQICSTGPTTRTNAFVWIDGVLDGGPTGRSADLRLTGSQLDRYWRIVGLVLLRE